MGKSVTAVFKTYLNLNLRIALNGRPYNMSRLFPNRSFRAVERLHNDTKAINFKQIYRIVDLQDLSHHVVDKITPTRGNSTQSHI